MSNGPVNDFETNAKAILNLLKANTIDFNNGKWNYKNPHPDEVALTAFAQLYQQETLKARLDEHDQIGYKRGQVSFYSTNIRYKELEQQRTNLNNTVKGDK